MKLQANSKIKYFSLNLLPNKNNRKVPLRLNIKQITQNNHIGTYIEPKDGKNHIVL